MYKSIKKKFELFSLEEKAYYIYKDFLIGSVKVKYKGKIYTLYFNDILKNEDNHYKLKFFYYKLNKEGGAGTKHKFEITLCAKHYKNYNYLYDDIEYQFINHLSLD